MNVAVFDDRINTLEECMRLNMRRALHDGDSHSKEFKVVPPIILIVDVVSSVIFEAVKPIFTMNSNLSPPSGIEFIYKAYSPCKFCMKCCSSMDLAVQIFSGM